MKRYLFWILLISSFILNGLFISGRAYFAETPSLFAFNELNSRYVINREDDGAYRIVYTNQDGDSKSVYIGSSKIPLEPYLNMPVHLKADFRSIHGFPNCYKPCDYSDNWILVDIREIYPSLNAISSDKLTK